MDPLVVEFDVDARKAFIKYLVQPTFQELQATLNRLFADPQFKPGFSLVLDRTAIHQPATTEHIKNLADFINQHHREQGVCRWAIVVSDLGSYGMGRMLEQITEFHYSVRTFRSMEDASSWIAEVA